MAGGASNSRSSGLRACCRSSLRRADVLACPDCGRDLREDRAYIERLMRPSCTWGGGVVVPINVLRKLAPDTRRDFANAIRAVAESVKKSETL